LFGGSVGPIKKQLPSGQFQIVYEGVKVRAQPLPLRVPTSPQQQQATNVVTVQQQQQTQVNQVQIPTVIQNSSQATPPPATPNPPGSPILTNLLHKNIPGNSPQIDASNPPAPDTKVCFCYCNALQSL